MVEDSLTGTTLDDVNDRALLQSMGVGQPRKRSQRPQRRKIAPKSQCAKQDDQKTIDHADAFGFVQWLPDGWSEAPHKLSKQDEKESIPLASRHTSRAQEVVGRASGGEPLQSYKGAFKALALPEDTSLGIQTTLPPARIFVITAKPGSWATLSRIRVGCEVIRVNGEFIEYVSLDEFQEAFRTRKLELTLLPPSRSAAVYEVNVVRDVYGDVGFRIGQNPLSIVVVVPKKQADLKPMQAYDLILGVNGYPVPSFEDYRKASRNLATFILILRRPREAEIPSHENGGYFKVRAKRDSSRRLGFSVIGLPLSIARIQPDCERRMHPMRKHDLVVAVNDLPLVSYSRYELATLGRDAFILTLRHAEQQEIDVRAVGDTYTVDVFRNDSGSFGFNVDFPPLSIGSLDVDWESTLHPMRQHDFVVAVNGIEVETQTKYKDAVHGLRGFTLTLKSRQFDVKVTRDRSGDAGFHIAHPPLSISYLEKGRAKVLYPMKVDDSILAVNGELVSNMKSYRDLVGEKRLFVVSLLHADVEKTRTKLRENGEIFEVTVEVNQFGDGGFSLDFPPLAIVNLQDFALHPAQDSDIVLAVDGLQVFSREEYREAVRDLEEFTLALRRPKRAELVSLHSFDVEIFCDGEGHTGFEIAHPPLSITKMSDSAKLLYTIRDGDRVMAVNGTPVTFLSEYERYTYGCASFTLTVVRPEVLGGAPNHRPARLDSKDTKTDGIHVAVKRTTAGSMGFQVEPTSLKISHVEMSEELFPMRVGDLICSVNDSCVTTYQEFLYMTECLDVFTLTLQDPTLSSDSISDVEIKLVGVKNLGRPIDMLESCNYFCVCQIQGVAESKVKTQISRKQANPVWNYSYSVKEVPMGAALEFSLFNQDEEGSEFLGKAILYFAQFCFGGFDGELGLEDTSSDSNSLLTVSVKTCTQKAPVRVTIIGAAGLRKADVFGSSDPYCVCEVQGKKDLKFETYVENNTQDPIWNHMYEMMDVCVGDVLDFTILDSDSGSANDLLGWASASWERFSSEGFHGELQLEDAGGGVDASIAIKIELIKAIPLEVSIVSALDIRRADILGGADPYCVCEVLDPYLESTRLRCQTPVAKDTLAPVWDFVHAFTEFPPSSSLKFSLWDKDTFGSDALGEAILANASIMPHGYVGDLALLHRKQNSALLTIKVVMKSAEPKPKPKRKRVKARAKSSSRSRNTADEAYRACYVDKAMEMYGCDYMKPWQCREAERDYLCTQKVWKMEGDQEKAKYNISTGGQLTKSKFVELYVFDIRYSADFIENRFHDGSELFWESLARFPSLKVAFHNGIHYALNNRYLYVLKTAMPHAKVRAELAHAPWISNWPPSTLSHGVRVSIKQESTLQHVCFGSGSKEFLVVSRLTCGRQQFRHEGIPEELAQCLQQLYADGFDISVVGVGSRSQWFVAGQCIDKRGLQMFWGGVPDDFATDLQSCHGKIIGVCFVQDGWLLHAEHNSVWRNVPRTVEKLLNSIYGGRRHLTTAALGPTGEYFMTSASDTADGDHRLHWGGMGTEFENAMKGDIECVSLGGADIFVAWSCDSTISWGVSHHLLSCPEFN